MFEFQNVSAFYGKQQILHNITLSIPENQITALIGKNGCGKSTLISCINEQVSYTGELLLDGISFRNMPLRIRAQKVAVLPQFLSNVPSTVEELVQMGRNPYVEIGRKLTKTDLEFVEKAISFMKIDALRHKKLNQLSGGERQKAYLAMILAQDTDIILLDEPTTYMDMAYEAEFMNLLLRLKEEYQKTILIIMHDLTSAVATADNIAILDKGELIYFGTTQKCVQKNFIEQIFQVKRFECMDEGVKRVLYHTY